MAEKAYEERQEKAGSESWQEIIFLNYIYTKNAEHKLCEALPFTEDTFNYTKTDRFINHHQILRPIRESSPIERR